jgi:hypothetical protein
MPPIVATILPTRFSVRGCSGASWFELLRMGKTIVEEIESFIAEFVVTGILGNLGTNPGTSKRHL